MRHQPADRNADGRKVNQSHHRSKLTDEQVAWARDQHEQLGIGARRLVAAMWERWQVRVSMWGIRSILDYRTRPPRLTPGRVNREDSLRDE